MLHSTPTQHIVPSTLVHFTTRKKGVKRVENCTPLGYCVASTGNFLMTFRDYLAHK
jgi:hypothetical protein